MHAAYPPAVFHASQATLQCRKAGRKPWRSTRLATSLYGERGYGLPVVTPATDKPAPFPPRNGSRISSIPLLTFCTPIAPTCRFPGENSYSPFANCEHFPVSPAPSGLNRRLLAHRVAFEAPGLRSPGH